jgi:hypothetical protein
MRLLHLPLLLLGAAPFAATHSQQRQPQHAGLAVTGITYHFESLDLGCPAGANGTLPELLPGQTATAGEFSCNGFDVNLTCTLHENGTLSVHDSCSDGGQFDGEPVEAGCSVDKWGDTCCFPAAAAAAAAGRRRVPAKNTP